VVTPSITTNPERAKRSLPAFVLLVGLAAEIYFLLGDFSPGQPSPNGAATTAPPIGELVERRAAVMLQNEGELVWESARDNQTLYRRQSVLTPQGGKAEIAFLDGTGLMVDENSLIVLEKTPSDDSSAYTRIVVRLLRGTLHKSSPRKSSDLLRKLGGPVGKTPEIEIESGGTRIELTPASEFTLTSSPEASGNARLTVRAGDIKVEAKGGASLTVKPGEEATLPAPGSAAAPEAKKLPFNLLSPKIGQTIEATGASRPVRFRWNATREAAAGRAQEVEVSRDPDFKSDVTRARIPSAEPPLQYVEINVTLPSVAEPAQWHWRVRAAAISGADAGELSGTQSFWTRPPEVPRPRYPAERARTALGATVDFAWDPIQGATGYDLEISGVEPQRAADSFAQVSTLPLGQASWRVRARLKDGDVTPWSPSRTLMVIDPSSEAAAQEPPPPPDELDEPEVRAAEPEPVPARAPTPRHTSLWDWLIAPAWATDPASSPAEAASLLVHLKWKAVQGAHAYKVQVSRDRNFTNIITEGESAAPEWDWNFKPGMENSKGRAFFRVASVSSSGKVGAFSKAKPISESVLAAASQSAQAKPETYPAQDLSPGAQPVGVADAAPKSDLSTLQPAAPAAAVAPKPVATIQPPSPLKTREAAPLAPPSSTATAALPVPVDAPAWSWSGEATLGAGYGSLSQTSAARDLTSVSPQAPYLQQKLSIGAELSRSDATAWRADLRIWLAGFSAPDAPPNPAQASFNAMGVRFEALHAWEKPADRWTLYLGGGVDRSYRWLANPDGLSVRSSGALSLGPSARAVRTYHYSDFYGPTETGVALNAPLTGSLTGGQLGIEGRIWGEWSLAKLSQKEDPMRIAFRTEAEAAYLRWQTPESTSTVAWTFWVAPALRF
jgi:hypothetical protein